ncbi:tRNA N6-adenosine threonylcarbamoyltransferase [Buchnera aphidicola (Neophyllaphis podocarpi)]|uniref:tRNA (adenosine(37)-N6)-threonylcarbamoyltransferase complex transferase subunit TsaD n=1 Tax=Buchnera aphidicola TaxID=9 RepID=UPI003463CFE9
MLILGIETSCDDIGIALYDDVLGLISHKLYKQDHLHFNYGGIVPELAARDHILNIVPVIKSVLKDSSISKKNISAIAYTAGPGLAGSLLIGAAVGSSLALSLDIPIIPINHMEGHLFSVMLENESAPEFPFIALLVSGGHTELILANAIGKYILLGKTLDDAAGEAFDKIARLLGLEYPGGINLSKIAKNGNTSRFLFPRPMTNSLSMDFSFSGLKTFASNIILKHKNDFQTKADIARAFEDAIVDTLYIQVNKCLKKTLLSNLVVSGGVSANHALRNKMNNLKGCKVFFPKKQFCTDNGAMIAYTGMLYFKLGYFLEPEIIVNPSWKISDVNFNFKKVN